MGTAPDTRPPAQRVATNTALRATSEIVGKVFSLVLFAYVARALGPGTLGDYAFAVAVIAIVASCTGLGLDRMALRDIARDKEVVDDLFWNFTGLKLLPGLPGVTIALAGVVLLDYSPQVQKLLLVLGGAMMVDRVVHSALQVFQAHERMEYLLYSVVPNRMLTSVFGISALALGGGIVEVAIASLTASVCSLLIAYGLMLSRFARPRLAVAPRSWPALARRSLPFGLQEAIGQVAFRVDTVLLSLLTVSAVVGSYNAAYRIFEATLFVAWSVGNSVLPMYSYLKRHGEPSLDAVFEGSLKFMAVVMVPISTVLLVCADAIVLLIFGPEYASTASVLRWLALTPLVYTLGHLAGLLVLVRRPGRLTVIITAVTAVFTIVLCLLLIPPYGAEGAAAATLATETLLAVLSFALARAAADTPRWTRVMGGPAIAAAAMAGAMLPFADRLLIALPLGAVVYLAVLAVFEARSLHGDLAAVRSVLSRTPGRDLGVDPAGAD